MKLQSIRLPLFSVLLVAGTMFFSSCKKEKSNNPGDPDQEKAVAVVEGDQLTSQAFNEVFNISLGVQSSDAGGDIGIGSGQGIIYRPGGDAGTEGDACFTVTVTPKVWSEWPKTVTWDFGDGCVGKDGKTRKGKIISVFTAPVFLTGAKVTTTFEGYQVNGYAISGTQEIENKSTPNNGLALSRKITDGRVTNTGTGVWHEIDADIDYAQVAGISTPLNFADDSYSLSGNIEGSSSYGFTWNTEATSPLIINVGCKWFGKGVLTLYWDTNPTPATLDYGDGACDNKATLKYKDWTHVINL